MLIMTIEFFDKLTQKYSIGKDFDFCDATSYRWVFVGDNDDHQCVKCGLQVLILIVDCRFCASDSLCHEDHHT